MFESKINPLWQSFILAVQEEVKPALGCTEPISLALAAAAAAAELDGTVERIDAWVSPNLMKNGMGVTVPGTGMVGLPIAAALGALGGDAKAGLEVLKDASAKAVANAKAMLAAGHVAVMLQEPCNDILFSRAKVYSGNSWACVTIVGDHTNIVRIETDKGVVFTQADNAQEEEKTSPLGVLSHTSLEEILAFVNAVPFDAIRFILDAARLNGALSQEGLRGSWGLHIGSTLAKQCDRGLLAKDLSTAILIRTSAASDARMGGATLPAMSNSGSGNQGITATVPVMVVAEHVGADDERLARALSAPLCPDIARALMLSHLSAIYIHHQLPRLSALCAATTAAMGAAAGMAWLIDGRYDTIAMAISSMIGDVSGMICDGASNSCAMKVSTSASAAWKAVLMALDDTAVTGNEGIVAHNVEQSISNLCSLACRSMQQTDKQIIEIMASKAH
ncbi:Putative inner membrane protein [Salmonella enterica subsp. enterica serovar Gaminara str. A4-567]|nr:Putative inner membrane protein [Salmonella enterica subsp. enterica serovar Gaminara str. A4-567]